jgi:DNA mismatch repair protein MutS2
VIPKRRYKKKSLRGIIHAESSSGATVFMEPQKAVSVGNELHQAESAEHRAELAVLRDLTALLRTSRFELEQGWDMCVTVDDLYARARYTIETEGERPSIVEAPAGMKIVGGRHPLLLAELDQVIPFEMETGPEDRVILISGPNTGGKTVLLKGVALFSALTQSGIIPPLKKGSVVPVFATIVSDIGDHQSIADSLSTYGAHLTAARGVLEIADDRTLVLVDELGTGTDPAEGAALAGALLQTLCARGCFTMATTHLGQLKQIGADTSGVVNASLQFDPDKLEPTYRFLLGVPGRSYGLALARRLGLPAEVLDRAEALRTETERSMEALLADLELREKELDDREATVTGTADRLNAQADGLELFKTQLGDERLALDQTVRDQEIRGREEARQYLLEARRRVEEALDIAQNAGTEKAAREARKVVEKGVQEEGSALDRLTEQAEKKGWKVKVGSAGRRKRAEAAPKKAAPKPAARIVRRAKVPIPDTDAKTEVDLRGMTGDEAELVVQRALDDAVVEGMASLRIIHGKGTGALRERIRIVLGDDQRVASADQASNYEGGWGVTIAMLK